MNARNKMKKENPQKIVMAWEEPWWSRGFCMDSVGASTQRYKNWYHKTNFIQY
jgi:hypothetical protein